MPQKLNAAWVWQQLTPRAPESNKGSYGRLLLAAGSTVYRGAAVLAAEAAARTGAGIVTLASVEPVLAAAVVRVPECCLLPCPADGDGGIAAGAAWTLREKANAGTALALGPGLGDTPGTRRLVEVLVRQARVPVLLDADGLNAAARMEALPRPACGAPLVITPHPGEMARLTGRSIGEIQAAREQTAAAYARANGCVVVLKGHRTLIAAPDGTMYENTTGNAGMARGGSGDVLTGMIGALLAQGLPAPEAAACGVWLHGAAGDGAAARLGQTGMLPHDLFAELGRLFAENGR